MTFAGAWWPAAGGTSGGLASTAWTGSPWGGPKAPLSDPPVVIAAGAAVVGLPAAPHPVSSAAAVINTATFVLNMIEPSGSSLFFACTQDSALWRRGL